MLDKKSKNILKESGLFPDEFIKEVEDNLSSYLEENKKLEESAKKKAKKNISRLLELPHGLTFSVGNFEITT